MDKHSSYAEVADAPNTKTISAVFGEIVWLMSQSSKYKYMQILELEEMLMLPIIHRQFRIYYKDGQPTAAVLYSAADAELDNLNKIVGNDLPPDENRSGSVKTLSVKHVIAPFGDEEYYTRESDSQMR